MRRSQLKNISFILIFALLSTTNTAFARLENPTNVIQIERKTIDSLVAAGAIKPDIIRYVSQREFDAAKSRQQIKTADAAGVILICVALYCAFKIGQATGTGSNSDSEPLNKPNGPTSVPETSNVVY